MPVKVEQTIASQCNLPDEAFRDTRAYTLPISNLIPSSLFLGTYLGGKTAMLLKGASPASKPKLPYPTLCRTDIIKGYTPNNKP